MFGRLSHTRLLRYAGLFTWAMVGAPLLYTTFVLSRGGASAIPGIGPWGWLAYLAFGALYFVLTLRMGRPHRRGLPDYVLMMLLLGCSVAVSHFSGSGLGSILMVVAATALPWTLPVGWGIVLLAVSQASIAPLFVWGQCYGRGHNLITGDINKIWEEWFSKWQKGSQADTLLYWKDGVGTGQSTVLKQV